MNGSPRPLGEGPGVRADVFSSSTHARLRTRKKQQPSPDQPSVGAGEEPGVRAEALPADCIRAGRGEAALLRYRLRYAASLPGVRRVVLRDHGRGGLYRFLSRRLPQHAGVVFHRAI